MPSVAFGTVPYRRLQALLDEASRLTPTSIYAVLHDGYFHSYLPVSPADFCEYPGFIHNANFAFDYNVPTLQRALYWKVSMGSKGITRVAGPLYVAGL